MLPFLYTFITVPCYIYIMVVEQIVEIPADRRITLEVPREVPLGSARIIIQFPTLEEDNVFTVSPEARGQTNNGSFRTALRRAFGAWQDNPWVNHLEDINAMRDEWDRQN